MNCRMFSDLVSDIARDQMMDAGVRTQALTHASECLNCADRLKAQQRLTSDLRELVSATEHQTASGVVWESLSATFDARGASNITTNRRRWIYAAGAIAAMLLLTFAVLSTIRRQPPHVEVSIPTSSTAIQPNQTNKAPEPGSRQKDLVVSVSRKPSVVPHRHSPARQTLARQTNAPHIDQPKEITTDFIPLTYGDPDVGSDAQMVRVELPRSAMARFGLPVNMDRSDQRVKADVLLGADGLARAIRFVQ